MIHPNSYDELESIVSRASQPDPWVMYLIARQSLNMSSGKLAAQAGHAVGMMYDYYSCLWLIQMNEDQQVMFDNFFQWKTKSFRKVTLKAKEGEWEKVKDQCYCFLVKDAGLTEVDPGSETVIGLWPMKKSQAPRLIRKLQVL